LLRHAIIMSPLSFAHSRHQFRWASTIPFRHQTGCYSSRLSLTLTGRHIVAICEVTRPRSSREAAAVHHETKRSAEDVQREGVCQAFSASQPPPDISFHAAPARHFALLMLKFIYVFILLAFHEFIVVCTRRVFRQQPTPRHASHVHRPSAVPMMPKKKKIGDRKRRSGGAGIDAAPETADDPPQVPSACFCLMLIRRRRPLMLPPLLPRRFHIVPHVARK